MKNLLKTKFALPAVAALLILIAVSIVKLQPDMVHSHVARPSIPVNYIDLESKIIRPELIGYGDVQPDINLQSNAEVAGRVVYSHPALKKGEIFLRDTVLLKIDDTDYRLALKQANADLLANEASYREVELNIENNQLELKLANKKLAVREKELARLTKLKKNGSISQSQLDNEQQNLFQQQQEVLSLKNKKTTLPSELEIVKAKIAISKAKMEKSERDLARTIIKIPFNGRISQVYAEDDQYVAIGSQLFDASGLDKIVVNAQFTTEQFAVIAKTFSRKKIDFNQERNLPQMKTILNSFGLTAEVSLPGTHYKAWSAKVERLSDDIDSQSRTIGVIVSVEDSYKKLEPGVRPPLLEGMYVKVALRGAPQKFLAFPRYALHQNEVYTISDKNTLKRVKLTELQVQAELALITNTLEAGVKIITSDVFPAVEGMDVTPILDEKLKAQLATWTEDAK